MKHLPTALMSMCAQGVGNLMIPQRVVQLSADKDDALAACIEAIVDPPACCPGCLAEAGQPWPDGATARHCRRCLDRIRRVYQCAQWNRDHAHQVAAGHS